VTLAVAAVRWQRYRNARAISKSRKLACG